MVKLNILTYILIGILFSDIVSAATVSGTIYDLGLKKLNNAKVEINTTPKQLIVSQNGSYSFNVPNGFYIIKAQLMQKNAVLASVEENITIKQDGSYTLDLVLFPNVEEGIGDVEIDVEYNLVKTGNYWLIIGFVIAIVLLLVIFYYFIKRYVKNKNFKKTQGFEDENLEIMIKIIKDGGGRATQKEIRKQIPLSEAKVSLMVAELEHKGIVEKIKKGRGNIIILKK